MLVMEYMDHGSLHDLLHNETILLDGELVLPILRDITQGLRFLQAANPPIIHVSTTVQHHPIQGTADQLTGWVTQSLFFLFNVPGRSEIGQCPC